MHTNGKALRRNLERFLFLLFLSPLHLVTRWKQYQMGTVETLECSAAKTTDTTEQGFNGLVLHVPVLMYIFEVQIRQKKMMSIHMFLHCISNFLMQKKRKRIGIKTEILDSYNV